MVKLVGNSGLIFGKRGFYIVNFVLATINIFLVAFNYFAFGNVLYLNIVVAIVLYAMATIFGRPPDFVMKLLEKAHGDKEKRDIR